MVDALRESLTHSLDFFLDLIYSLTAATFTKVAQYTDSVFIVLDISKAETHSFAQQSYMSDKEHPK